MKSSLSYFLVTLTLISSCTSNKVKNSKEFKLQGEINGQDSGIIVLSYFHDETSIYDTSIIENGKFTFTGEIFEPTIAIFSGRNKLYQVFIYLEPKKMKIYLSNDKLEECKMIGSKTQNDFDLLNKMEKPFHERILILRDQYDKITDSIKKSKDDYAKILLKKKADEIDRLWSKTGKKIDSIQVEFILENPKSFLAVVYLRRLVSNDIISFDSAKSIFNGLNNSLKESRYGKYIIEDFRKKENVLLGAQAPDFKATDLNEQTVTLSQFKGRSVVLVDFWASWCAPCRESLPHLKTIYNNYHSKGFDIIAVSTDESRKAWIEEVKRTGTDMWYHILIAEKWPNGPITNDDIFQNYFNTAIPEQILIDKNGKIIYRHVGYSKESEESLDRLLSQIFEN